jgi:hypothetical protein
MAQRVQDYKPSAGSSSGGGLFDNFSKGDAFLMTQLAGSLGDMGTRNAQGELAAVEAATAPFGKGSITDQLEKGPAGSDLAGDIGTGLALKELSDERDRRQELLAMFGAGAAGARNETVTSARKELERARALEGQ